MLAARSGPGARGLAYERKELQAGRLRSKVLTSPQGDRAGFALFLPPTTVGLQLSLYLLPGHRSRASLRRQVESLLADGPVFSISGRMNGVTPATQRAVLPALGFRPIQRRRLWIDPRHVRPAEHRAPSLPMRNLRRSDERALARLFSLAYAHHIDGASGPGGVASRWAPWYAHHLLTKGNRGVDLAASFVVEGRRGPIGDVVVARAGRFPHIQDLSVHPAHRGEGIGSALLRRALGALAERGERCVEIAVTAQNPTGAAELYAHLGFRPRRASWTYGGLWVNEAARRHLDLRVLSP